MKIITGKTNTSHVNSSDDGGRNAAIVGENDYVFDIGEKFAYQVIDNNTVKISDGELMMQGRHGRIEANSTETVYIENGAQNVRRRDVIVCEYTKNSGIESMNLKVVKGTPGENEVQPSIISGSIRDGASIHQMPLYQVVLNGLTIESVTPVYQMMKSIEKRENELESVIKRIILEENKSRYPVGHIIMTTNDKNPATYLGFGTWTQWGSGRVPVGVNATETEFSAVEKIGGEKTHKLTQAEMAGHTHSFTPSGSIATNGSHTHSVSGTAASSGVHTHDINAKYDKTLDPGSGTKPLFHTGGDITAKSQVFSNASDGAHTHNVSGTAASGGGHTHTFNGNSGNTGNVGSDSEHNNLQPYIVCYMWKRTA